MIAIICCVVLLADQLSKFVVRATIPFGDSVPVWPGCFSLTLVGNTGAAWGMFQGRNNALVALSIATLVVMFVFRKSFATSLPMQKLAVGLILGGIFGNLIDRVWHGQVIDFLDFYWEFPSGVKRWPAFNVADSGICAGAFLYMLSALWQPKTKEPTVPTNPPSTELASEQK
jgi:signal peptidase II